MAENKISFLEKNLEDIIFESAQTYEGIYALKERGLPIGGVPYRQVNFGSYGIADLITASVVKEVGDDTVYGQFIKGYDNFHVSNVLHFTVYELKKDEVNVGTLKQALNYAKAIKLIFSEKGNLNRYPKINIVLIGKSIEKTSSFIYMADFFSNLSIYTYEYAIDGIKFKEHSGYKQKGVSFINAEKLTDIFKRDVRKIIDADKKIKFHNQRIWSEEYNKKNITNKDIF